MYLECLRFGGRLDIVEIDNRSTYQDIFGVMNKYAGKYKSKNNIFIFANLDIYFDHSISLLDYIDLKNKCLALTRWDVGVDGKAVHHNRVDSQDVWIFSGAIKKGNYDYYFGKPGCDNRLDYELNKAGYELENP